MLSQLTISDILSKRYMHLDGKMYRNQSTKREKHGYWPGLEAALFKRSTRINIKGGTITGDI